MKKCVRLMALLPGLFLIFFFTATPALALPLVGRVVLVDAGHGAKDPGSLSGSVPEKNINLAIALKLQNFLEMAGATVLMTRIDDEPLADSKAGDMYKRKLIANNSQADIFVSIHQNSFPRASVRGAQVFFYNTSDNSRLLAEHIQAEIKNFASPYNKLQAKANTSYYVLRETTMPAVLVECGFLTNPEERYLLTRETYQEKMAWSIYVGILNYFNVLV